MGRGDTSNTDVHVYNIIVYRNIYPNIDIVFYGGKEKGLKYDIVIKPGGNPNDIKIKYTGADEIEVFVTHPVLSKIAPKILQESGVNSVHVTDTIFVPENKQFPKLHSLSVSALIAEELR